MSVKFKISMFYDFDENEYVCFIGSTPPVEGRGATEQDAIDDFRNKLEIASRD